MVMSVSLPDYQKTCPAWPSWLLAFLGQGSEGQCTLEMTLTQEESERPEPKWALLEAGL
jgi:hypothetical protein